MPYIAQQGFLELTQYHIVVLLAILARAIAGFRCLAQVDAVDLGG